MALQRYRGRVAAALFAGLVAACGGGDPPPGPVAATTFAHPRTLVYCHEGGVALTLDLHGGAGAAPHPLLIVVHGGSWSFGSATMTTQNPLTQKAAARLLGQGFSVASINYRLAPAHPWPAQIVDLRCAVRFLRASAARLGLNPGRFAIAGNSAGGQLASLLALSDGQAPQWDGGEHAGVSTSVRAVVDLWAPVDLEAAGWGRDALAIGSLEFQTSWGMANDELRAASPVSWIHPGAPSILMIHGAADALVPLAQSVELGDRLRAAGDGATLITVSHAGHELKPSGGTVAPTIDDLAARVAAFVDGST